MGWLLRKFAAVLAAYVIALQALLSGFAPAPAVSPDTFAVICTTDGAGEHAPSLPQSGGRCDACLAASNASPALLPASAAVSPAVFGGTPKHVLLAVEAPAGKPRRQLQESRAPPLSS